jgi:hypothetical protein
MAGGSCGREFSFGGISLVAPELLLASIPSTHPDTTDMLVTRTIPESIRSTPVESLASSLFHSPQLSGNSSSSSTSSNSSVSSWFSRGSQSTPQSGFCTPMVNLSLTMSSSSSVSDTQSLSPILLGSSPLSPMSPCLLSSTGYGYEHVELADSSHSPGISLYPGVGSFFALFRVSPD